MPTDRSKKHGGKDKPTLCDRLRDLFSRDSKEVEALRSENENLKVAVKANEDAGKDYFDQFQSLKKENEKLKADKEKLSADVARAKKEADAHLNEGVSLKAQLAEVEKFVEDKEKDADLGD